MSSVEINECLNEIVSSSIHDIFSESEEIDNLYDQYQG